MKTPRDAASNDLACAARLACAALAVVAAGCARRPPSAPSACRPQELDGCLVDEVVVTGSDKVPGDVVKESIATVGLSGLDRIIGDPEHLNPLVLERDLQRVERLYHARGFYEARARVGALRFVSARKVRVEIIVSEGTPVVVDRRAEITFKPPDPPAEIGAAVAGMARSVKIGAPIEEVATKETAEKIERGLVDAGYAYAKVSYEVKLDLIAHGAHVAYTVSLGRRARSGSSRSKGRAPSRYPASRMI